MQGSFYLVVGNDYEVFAANEHVITAANFIQRLRDSSLWDGDEHVVLGQGIGDREALEIRGLLRERSLSSVKSIGELVPLHLTHKRSVENVLIAAAQKRGEYAYRFHLALNDKQDRLSDHVTGQHISAMQLMEAARQAVVAALECEYPTEPGSRMGFILERFDSRFENYMFPVPTDIFVTIAERSNASDKHRSVTLTIDFAQVAQKVCQMQLDVRLYDIKVLAKLEARRARSVVGSLMHTELSGDSSVRD